MLYIRSLVKLSDRFDDFDLISTTLPVAHY
jgi:hypothetical protein